MTGEFIQNRSDGTTQSEMYLASLGRNAFLYLWAYPNLYRDQGATKIGIGKELCDLLVVFGRDIIVFSDKHCNLKLSDRPEVAWKRWYRDAVVRSAAQVRGAVRWLRQYPNRVYLDQKCGRRLPIALPSHPDFHRVLTCRGSADAAAKFWGGSSSLLVGNGPLAATDFPLQLGAFDEEGSLFHVFDEVALDSVLKTLDTVSDFCDYLRKREQFFRNTERVVASGEEELLGQYLLSEYRENEGHDFRPPSDANLVVVSEGFWDGWLASEQRAAKLRADAPSYSWDTLRRRPEIMEPEVHGNPMETTNLLSVGHGACRRVAG